MSPLLSASVVIESNEPSRTSLQMRKSNSHNVTIRALTRNHTGLYQCEVSADAPLFHTLTKSAQMQIAVMPETEPEINIYGVATREDNKRHINYGDQLKASCIAGPSNPPVNFTWRVNDVVFPVGGCLSFSSHLVPSVHAIHPFITLSLCPLCAFIATTSGGGEW